jgi:hypothetical protein
VQTSLPATGTAKLLAVLSRHVPDAFINHLLPGNRQQGRRNYFSAGPALAGSFARVVLSPAHSFNAVVLLLPEQPAWRHFARLKHRERTPDVRMLSEFRAQAGVAALRRINEHLIQQLLSFLPAGGQTVALIDATDLPAATADKKKTGAAGRPSEPPWVRVRSKPDTHGFSSVIKNTPCVCGCAVMNLRCC